MKRSIKVEVEPNGSAIEQGDFVALNNSPDRVFKVVKAGKRVGYSDSTNAGYTSDASNFVCIALDGNGELLNLHKNQIELFTGKITITV